MRMCVMVLLLASCSVSRPTFKCADWEDCGPGGACEPGTESCSFADDSCTKTGRRFSSIAPDPYRDTCVPFQPEAPAAALCDPAMPACGASRECIGGRCVSTSELKAGKLLHCGRCAVAPNDFGPLFCWGESLIYMPFEPVLLQLPGFICPTGFCPPECAMCPGNESDPTKCPLSCSGANATFDYTVGENHICTFSGRTYCYGHNDQKQLGQGDTVLVQGSFTSVRLDAPLDHLSAGSGHTCGRGASSRVMCWGNNEAGQCDMNNGPSTPPSAQPIGNGPFEPMGTQIGVDFVAVSADFSCAASNDNVRCWGNVPWTAGFVPGLPPGQITDFDVGLHHACAIKGKRVVCWGNNRQGQAAPAAPSLLAEPTIVLDVEATRVVTGRAHSCAIDKAGAIWCWGDSSDDQLDGATGPGPVKVRSDPPAVGPLSAGADVTCAVHADDRVRCFGDVLQTASKEFRDFQICNR